MKIIVPICTIDELEMLLGLGTDELYVEIITPEWEKTCGTYWWLSRDRPEITNLFSLAELKRITGKAHNRGVSVHIVMNAYYYSASGQNHAVNLCKKLVEDVRIDGLIVSDLNLLTLLVVEKLPVNIHLSSRGRCFNSESVEFYQALGVNRIILPPQKKIPDINRLIKDSNTEMEFEVSASNRGGPNAPCGLCWFGRFRDWGVTAVEIVEQEASFSRKKGLLQLANAVMDKVREKLPAGEIASYARYLCDAREYCPSP